MPELSRFYGIVVQMYYGDHGPPHFHALYAGQTAIIDIETLAFIDGQLPARARGMVVEWGHFHSFVLADAARLACALHGPCDAEGAAPRVRGVDADLGAGVGVVDVREGAARLSEAGKHF